MAKIILFRIKYRLNTFIKIYEMKLMNEIRKFANAQLQLQINYLW